jgi:Coenzyme PQQ synthesis protein D (PqqD)
MNPCSPRSSYLLQGGDDMPSISPQLRSRVTPDGAMILDISADEVITLNATGGYIWARLEEGKTVDQIIENLATETGHDPVIVAKDVRGFIGQIAEKHLVTL